MSVLDDGRTLADATKTYVATTSAFRPIQLLTALGFVLAIAVALWTYPAEPVFVWTATTVEALSGGDLTLGFLFGLVVVLAAGIAYATTLLSLCSALATAAITGIVDADAVRSTPEIDPRHQHDDVHRMTTPRESSLRAAALGIWRAKRALPWIVLLTGLLGPVVVLLDRRLEVLSERLGPIGALLGHSPGTYAHLAIPIAATEGCGARQALRTSRRRLADAYGDDVLATPGIVPTAGSAWLVPGLLLTMLGYAALALHHGSPDAVPDTQVLLVGIPVALGALLGTTRAIVLQSTFRAAHNHHLRTNTTHHPHDTTNHTPIVPEHEVTVHDAYTPADADGTAESDETGDHAQGTGERTAEQPRPD